MPDTIIFCQHLLPGGSALVNSEIQLHTYRIRLCEACSDVLFDGLENAARTIDLRNVEIDDSEIEEDEPSDDGVTDDGDTDDTETSEAR
jgi:hypothetical protein